MRLSSFLKSFVIALPVGVTFCDCVGYVARVEGTSMQPVLNPDSFEGDYVFLNRWSVRLYQVSRGDIISLISPNDPSQKIIKRITGLEGDIVSTPKYKQNFVRVPPGHCWVEGDHRGHSMDSNYFGPVALGLVTAKASHIIWPPSRWQSLSSTFSTTANKNVISRT